MCPPGKYHQHFLYSCRGDPRGRPFHVVNDVELTAARAVTTLHNKRFNPFKASPVAKLRGRWHFALRNDGGGGVSVITLISSLTVGVD